MANSYSKSEMARRPLRIDVRVPPAGELHDELVEAVDDDVVVPGERLPQEVFALVRREQRRLALRLLDEPDDHAAELGGAAGDDVEVADGDGVERARADGGDVAGHQSLLLLPPPMRPRRRGT